MARPICFKLLTHCARRAASRADCTAGSKSEIKTAMIAMTTSSSISVKPLRVTFFIKPILSEVGTLRMINDAMTGEKLDAP
jgi:hypothetical protein